MRTPRRQLLGLGLGGGLLALLQSPLTLAASKVAEQPLRFQLARDFQPALTPAAASRLVSAVLAFLERSHPPGMTLSMWTQNPRDMPFLPAHLEQVVEQLFAGIAANREVWPVDPVLVLSLIYNESRFNPVAVSPAGAAGIGQFMPDTALEYGLTPLAEAPLWERFRTARQADRQARNERIRRYRERWQVAAFSADAAISRALELRDLAVLEQFREIAALRGEAETVRRNYVQTLREGFTAVDYFKGGREQLAEVDGRTQYAAVAATVTYIARQLRQNDGMATSAVAAYNAGPASVRVQSRESILYPVGDIPPIPETVRYVQRILAVYSAISRELDLQPAV